MLAISAWSSSLNTKSQEAKLTARNQLNGDAEMEVLLRLHKSRQYIIPLQRRYVDRMGNDDVTNRNGLQLDAGNTEYLLVEDLFQACQ